MLQFFGRNPKYLSRYFFTRHTYSVCVPGLLDYPPLADFQSLPRVTSFMKAHGACACSKVADEHPRLLFFQSFAS